jgi:hypothetical protein
MGSSLYMYIPSLRTTVLMNIILLFCLCEPGLTFVNRRLTYSCNNLLRSANMRRIAFALHGKSPTNPGSDYAGDESDDADDNFDGEKVVPNMGSAAGETDVEREFLLEKAGVGPVVYAQLVPLVENLVTKFVRLEFDKKIFFPC